MQRALFIIFALWGSVKLLDLAYTHVVRPHIAGQVAAAKKRPRPAPRPYTDVDRARDAQRAAFLQREAEKNPNLARIARARSAARFAN
jgi:hypothetical protein